MRRIVLGLLLVGASASAEPVDQQPPLQGPNIPHTAVVPVQLAAPPPTLVNSHTLFLNNCRPNGCPIVRDPAGDDSRTNHSQIAPASGTLGALSASVDFASIEACVKGALAPFNITVTDVDPGNTPHFEMIIAGKPTELGFSSDFEGVAPYLCAGAPGSCVGTYIPNAITFAFANSYGTGVSGVNLMCGVALQETAHGWTLDHATATSDPMTYHNYTTPLSYRDNAPCGSDCLYGASMNQNSFGVQCAGTGLNGTHVCMENNQATQNEVQIISSLFGPAGSQPPTVAITTPVTGSAVQVGQPFPVNVTCTSADGIKEIDFLVDDMFRDTKTASPAMFTGQSTLAVGTHHVQVICGTNKLATASASVDVIVGNVCAVDADCGGNGMICYEKACIAGPMATGGLGAACTGNGDCKSGMCGNDGNQSLCVIPCDPNNAACPDGFSCLDAGNGTGVCFLGDGGSSGCCETGHNTDSRGPILLGFGIVAMWITRRKPAKQ